MSDWPFLRNGKPPHISSGEGVYLYTQDGKEILDAAAGAVATNIGHGRTEVADVIRESVLKLDYIIPPWNCDERQQLVERLRSSWLPASFNRFHFTSGGSEAIESAMRIAVMYHSAHNQRHKCKIIGRDISYHGTTLGTIALGGHEARKVGIEHVLPAFPKVVTPYPLRCESNDPTSYYLDAFRLVLEEEGPDTVAAIVGEPILGASGGAMVPPDGYWEGVREICNEHDILWIADEVMTGFARTGTKFGYQHWDAEPDIIVSGKGLACGYAPINGVFSTDKIAEPIERAPGYAVMFHTYGSHPPGCAAADKVLEILEREDLVNRARTLGETLETKLQSAFSNHPHVAECRGKGMLQAIEVVKNRTTLETYDLAENVTGKIVNHSFENGVHFYGAGTGVVRDVVLIGPPLTIEERHIDQMVGVLSDAVDSVTQTTN